MQARWWEGGAECGVSLAWTSMRRVMEQSIGVVMMAVAPPASPPERGEGEETRGGKMVGGGRRVVMMAVAPPLSSPSRQWIANVSVGPARREGEARGQVRWWKGEHAALLVLPVRAAATASFASS